LRSVLKNFLIPAIEPSADRNSQAAAGIGTTGAFVEYKTLSFST
jgi:hypothetical protein